MAVCRMHAVGHAVFWTSTAHRQACSPKNSTAPMRSASAVREPSGLRTLVRPAGIEEALLLGCTGQDAAMIFKNGLGAAVAGPCLARRDKYDRWALELPGTSGRLAVLHTPGSARCAGASSRQFNVVIAANSILRKGVGQGANKLLGKPERLPVVWRVAIDGWCSDHQAITPPFRGGRG